MQKTRVIKCGNKFKVQQKGWFFWWSIGTLKEDMFTFESKFDVNYYDTFEEADDVAKELFEESKEKIVKIYD